MTIPCDQRQHCCRIITRLTIAFLDGFNSFYFNVHFQDVFINNQYMQQPELSFSGHEDDIEDSQLDQVYYILSLQIFGTHTKSKLSQVNSLQLFMTGQKEVNSLQVFMTGQKEVGNRDKTDSTVNNRDMTQSLSSQPYNSTSEKKRIKKKKQKQKRDKIKRRQAMKEIKQKNRENRKLKRNEIRRTKKKETLTKQKANDLQISIFIQKLENKKLLNAKTKANRENRTKIRNANLKRVKFRTN